MTKTKRATALVILLATMGTTACSAGGSYTRTVTETISLGAHYPEEKTCFGEYWIQHLDGTYERFFVEC